MSDFRETNSKTEHRRIREMLSVYIDGELPSGDRARVKEHLAGCADCTWELETLRQTVDLVGQLPRVPVPRAFTIQETLRPKRIGLFQDRWAYTYLKGATALAAVLLILVLAGDALFRFQGATTSFAPAMAPAKELVAPTVVAMQEAPPAPLEAPILPEEALDEAEGAAYAEVTPLPPPGEETKTIMSMPTPTAPAARGDGLTTRVEATATPLAPPAPLGGKAEASGTPPPAAVEVPAEGSPEAPMLSAAAPMATPQPQMTATPILAEPPAPVSAAASTPTPSAIETATAPPVPTATPVSVARAPAEVRPTEESALPGRRARPQEPRPTLLRVVEASLCLLVIALLAATLIVRRRTKT
jgi:hypothetical protein